MDNKPLASQNSDYTLILKIDDESLNGAWTEKIASELAKLIGIPTARYEFAKLPDDRKTILSPNYLYPAHNEQSGKMLLDRYFGQNKYSYTVNTVLKTIDANSIGLLRLNQIQ